MNEDQKHIIITGGPGSGKTTLINQLERMGFGKAEEVHRKIIQKEQNSGGNGLPWEDFERFAVLAKEAFNNNFQITHSSCFLFHDRGILDLEAYQRYYAKDLEISFEEFRNYEKTVFWLKPNGSWYRNDPQRPQSLEEALHLGDLIYQNYSEKGYEVVEVKGKNSKEKAQFILNFLGLKTRKINIVGAGPGDPDLLTIKAHRLILEADIIFYDNLVSAAILNLNEKAEKIYVGKKFGDGRNPVERQAEINQSMEESYREGKHVVRLKSGDPYVYGRAAEEVRYMKDKGLPCEVIPGITAGLAAACSLNIPLTERLRSSSFVFCTAHTADYSDEQLNALGEMMAQGANLVMYMGFTSLKKICQRFSPYVDDSIFITAVSNVGREEEAWVSCPITEAPEGILSVNLALPVIFIIGKNAKPIV
ncbi:uroporphyrinogen-III C-methyltransferase [Xanthovirga aplysinae]|uniref:uroporphyrinogen-III C-methyltransferase n=1 Tax=Xanthovirga aplysinae TaxID=2529853 RepID=UPI0012BCA3E7|nr:uroporphyrinogen-III C-methyltransferase [Xanthovirga aplysinae]MTI32341.1 uroporphyrinogen-III C-methyltransferase [Xanthovirga aplysinae]